MKLTIKLNEVFSSSSSLKQEAYRRSLEIRQFLSKRTKPRKKLEFYAMSTKVPGTCYYEKEEVTIDHARGLITYACYEGQPPPLRGTSKRAG